MYYFDVQYQNYLDNLFLHYYIHVFQHQLVYHVVPVPLILQVSILQGIVHYLVVVHDVNFLPIEQDDLFLVLDLLLVMFLLLYYYFLYFYLYRALLLFVLLAIV